MRFKNYFLIALIFLFLISFVYAQTPSTEQEIDKAAEELENKVNTARGFTEAEYWENIGVQWKEFLLRNKAVSSVNSFFTKINIVFIILFGMDWSLSANMFFALFFWVIMFFSINRYMASIDKGGIGFLYSLIIVVLLAQINLFEYVGKWSVALVFYKGSVLWKVLFFLFIIGLFVGFWAFSRSISNFLKKRKEEKEKKKDRKAKETFGKMINAAVEGASKNH